MSPPASRICISAQGVASESLLDSRFGRAAHLLLVDEASGAIREIPEAAGASHGAGVQAAQAVILARAEVVITGHLGPKAQQVLFAAGLKAFECGEVTVSEALELYRTGQLSQIRDSQPR